MDSKKGYVHIYYGNGKGKTTSAMGLCTRAAGYGYKILVYQFMKDNSTSERNILEKSTNVTWIKGLPLEKFSFQMSDSEKRERKQFYESQFKEIIALIQKGNYNMLLLDELIYTIAAGLFDEQLLLSFLDSKPYALEVIITGNPPSDELVRRADYASEIKKIKHPFDIGLCARKGIES